MMTNRGGTYMRTAAAEGLEGKIKVRFEPELRNQHAHHHDARLTTCRPDYAAATDGLGPIEDEDQVRSLSA